MGFYPQESYDHRSRSIIKTVSQPGLEVVYIFELVATIENRTNCYCCSCPDDPYPKNDINCRNHGWYGTKPCAVHQMDGINGETGEVIPWQSLEDPSPTPTS